MSVNIEMRKKNKGGNIQNETQQNAYMWYFIYHYLPWSHGNPQFIMWKACLHGKLLKITIFEDTFIQDFLEIQKRMLQNF